jgi:hypothetical protein
MFGQSFDEGYYAGLVNDRDNPHLPFTFSYVSWSLGNAVGVEQHLAIVESVYLKEVA